MNAIFPSGPQSRDTSGERREQQKVRVSIHNAVHAFAAGKLGTSRLLFAQGEALNVDKLFDQYAPDVVVDALQREVMEQRTVPVEQARKIVFGELLTETQKWRYLGLDAQAAAQQASMARSI